MYKTWHSLKQRLKSSKLKKKIENRDGISISEFMRDVQGRLNENYPELRIKKSRFVNLGGFNNSGMIFHSDEEGVRAFTKLQPKALAEREWRFQHWQYTELNNSIAVRPFLHDNVMGSDLGWVSTEVLNPAKVIEDSELLDLYRRLNVSTDSLGQLSLVGNGIRLSEELVPDTKIKSLLLHLVSGVGNRDDIDALKEFFNLRCDLFRGVISLEEFLAIAHDVYNDTELDKGLVHGDFKPQNIMRDNNGLLKVIDLQYYTYGRRIWDLSFYYSKSARSFHEIIKNASLDFSSPSEKQAFTFYYLVASALNVKRKRYNKIRKSKLNDAAAVLRSFNKRNFL